MWLSCIALHAVPVWIVPHYPSQDGASHVYQATVLRHYAEVPLLWQHFELNLTIFPNWLGFALLQPLLALWEPAVAEKVLLTAYVCALPLAVLWVLACMRSPVAGLVAFLSFPLTYCYCLQVGLYNYCLAVPLGLFTIGLWWRLRLNPSLVSALALAVLLVALYLTHLFAFLLTLGVLLWLALLGVRRLPVAAWPSLLLAAAPAVALTLHYLATQPKAVAMPYSLADRCRELLLGSGIAFSDAHRGVVAALCVLLLVLAALTVRRWSSLPEQRAFAWTAVAMLVGSLLVPGTTTGGGLLAARVHWFAFLLVVPALAPEAGPRLSRGLAVAVGALIAANLLCVCRHNLRLSVDYEEFLSGIPFVAPQTMVVPVFTSVAVPEDSVFLSPLPHAINVYGYERMCASIANWHAIEHAEPRNFPVLARHGFDMNALPPGPLYYVVWSATPLAASAPSGTALVFTSTTGRLHVLRRS